MWKIRTKRQDGIIISSVEPPFMNWFGKYETALIIGESIRILEGYEDRESCIKGHNKYVNMSKEELINLVFIG